MTECKFTGLRALCIVFFEEGTLEGFT